MQAEAAQLAGRHLRAASEVAAGATTGGRRASSPPKKPRAVPSQQETNRYVSLIHSVLPDRAGEICSDEAWPALATTLAAADKAGYDPGTVLGEVTAARELGTAESVAQVLTWRLQGRMKRDEIVPPKTLNQAARKTPVRKPEKRQSQRRLGEQTEAQKAAQRARENRSRGPHH